MLCALCTPCEPVVSLVDISLRIVSSSSHRIRSGAQYLVPGVPTYPVSLFRRRFVPLRQWQHARLHCQQEKYPSEGDAWLTACRGGCPAFACEQHLLFITSSVTCGDLKLVFVRILVGNVLAARVTAGLFPVQHRTVWMVQQPSGACNKRMQALEDISNTIDCAPFYLATGNPTTSPLSLLPTLGDRFFVLVSLVIGENGDVPLQHRGTPRVCLVLILVAGISPPSCRGRDKVRGVYASLRAGGPGGAKAVRIRERQSRESRWRQDEAVGLVGRGRSKLYHAYPHPSHKLSQATTQ